MVWSETQKKSISSEKGIGDFDAMRALLFKRNLKYFIQNFHCVLDVDIGDNSQTLVAYPAAEESIPKDVSRQESERIIDLDITNSTTDNSRQSEPGISQFNEKLERLKRLLDKIIKNLTELYDGL